MMKRYLRQGFLVIAVMFLLGQSASAALSPRYRNIRDLDSMVEFIKEHPSIAASLESIDFKNHTIHFTNGCKAVFVYPTLPAEREKLPGPGPSLEFKRPNCDEHEGEGCLLDEIITH
ncbi:MAG: hypothetical protein HOK67_18125 [Deltaproteobacteria bacterium]|jgi:hypothetical protein|nr:hypothetical protein [Deltaproteobacteria bacterium]